MDVDMVEQTSLKPYMYTFVLYCFIFVFSYSHINMFCIEALYHINKIRLEFVHDDGC